MVQGGVGQYSVGYFTAGGTTQSFTNLSAVSSQFNALQVRDVTGSWAGNASGDWDSSSLNFSGLSYSGVTGHAAFSGGGNFNDFFDFCDHNHFPYSGQESKCVNVAGFAHAEDQQF